MENNIENIIQELVKIEDAAAEITKLMAEDRKKLPEMIKKRSQELEAEMAAKTKKAVEEIKSKAYDEADEKIAEITSSTQMLFSKLEMDYEKNSEKWMAEIFNKVTEVV